MASERNEIKATPGSAPAQVGSQETTVADLERRLREKREEIGTKVSEIKSTMTTEYASTKHQVEETMNWKHQMERYPLAACLGALAIGFVAGRVLGQGMIGSSHPSGSNRSRGYSSSSGNIGAGMALTSSSGQTAMSEDHGSNGGSRMAGRVGSMMSSAKETRIFHRIEDVLSDVADQFLNEVQKVGREQIVPTVIGSLTSAFQNATSSAQGRAPSRNTASASGSGVSGLSGSTSASGPATGFTSTNQETSNRDMYQGRNL